MGLILEQMQPVERWTPLRFESSYVHLISSKLPYEQNRSGGEVLAI